MLGCVRDPLTTCVSVIPSTPQVGKQVRVVVSASNRTRDEVLVPPYVDYDGKTVMDQSGVIFVRDPKDRAVTRNSVSWHPPFYDRIAPKETREYAFYWTPSLSDVGDGFILVDLPGNFRPIKPIPVHVTK